MVPCRGNWSVDTKFKPNPVLATVAGSSLFMMTRSVISKIKKDCWIGQTQWKVTICLFLLHHLNQRVQSNFQPVDWLHKPVIRLLENPFKDGATPPSCNCGIVRRWNPMRSRGRAVMTVAFCPTLSTPKSSEPDKISERSTGPHFHPIFFLWAYLHNAEQFNTWWGLALCYHFYRSSLLASINNKSPKVMIINWESSTCKWEGWSRTGWVWGGG